MVKLWGLHSHIFTPPPKKKRRRGGGGLLTGRKGLRTFDDPPGSALTGIDLFMWLYTRVV